MCNFMGSGIIRRQVYCISIDQAIRTNASTLHDVAYFSGGPLPLTTGCDTYPVLSAFMDAFIRMVAFVQDWRLHLLLHNI